jgi:predicted HD phosphohydrolase
MQEISNKLIFSLYSLLIYRYLATSPEYLSSLSKASQSSLKAQGGPFTIEEKERFESLDPIWREKVALRRFDDGAKVVGRRTRDLQEWWEVAHRVYEGKGRTKVEMVEVEALDSGPPSS